MDGVSGLNVCYGIVSFFWISQGDDMMCIHWLHYYIIPLHKQ